ncbi:MAG TPA: hypothetical protein VLH84_02755 [Patescibacteria group bacterium]|nr:hypothetical protein [Patescibacteria group bacterium]
MSYEGSLGFTVPPGAEAVGQPAIDYGTILGTHGLGPEDLGQPLTYGGHTGSLAEAIADPRCPVGGILGGAYRDGGFAGLQEKIGQMGDFMGVSITVSPRTAAFHEGRLSLADLLTSPQTEPPTESEGSRFLGLTSLSGNT